MKEFALYLNGINGLSLGGAAVLKSLNDQGLHPKRMYACGIGALFANDFAALDEHFEERITQRFSHLSKSFRLFIDTGESLFSKFTNAYKLATSVTSKRVRGLVSERFMLSRLQNTSKPKMELYYSAVNIVNAREILISPREWRMGLRASMSIVPIFAPCDYRNQKLVSTTSVTGVPAYSNLDEEKAIRIFINTMPSAGKKRPTRTWEIMMRADYLRTLELTRIFSKKFNIVLNFSELTPEISDFSFDAWRKLSKISDEMVENVIKPILE